MKLIKDMLEENKKQGLKFNYRIDNSNIYLTGYENQTDIRIQLKEDVRLLAKEFSISLKLDTSELEVLTLKKLNKHGGWRFICNFYLRGEC